MGVAGGGVECSGGGGGSLGGGGCLAGGTAGGVSPGEGVGAFAFPIGMGLAELFEALPPVEMMEEFGCAGA